MDIPEGSHSQCSPMGVMRYLIAQVRIDLIERKHFFGFRESSSLWSALLEFHHSIVHRTESQRP